MRNSLDGIVGTWECIVKAFSFCGPLFLPGRLFWDSHYKAVCLLLYDNRKWFFGNAVSPMERGTPSSDNQESFFACLIVVKNDTVFHLRNLYNVEFERVSS